MAEDLTIFRGIITSSTDPSSSAPEGWLWSGVKWFNMTDKCWYQWNGSSWTKIIDVSDHVHSDLNLDITEDHIKITHLKIENGIITEITTQ